MATRIRVTVVTSSDGKPTTRIFRNESDAWRAYLECKRGRVLYLFGIIGALEQHDSIGVSAFTRGQHFDRRME
jgi:hypothetical protein